MGLYFGETEMQGLHLGDMEITGLYFGETEIWAAWAEYDGTLPAQYSANGSMLADYRIYGAAGGVGDDSGTAYGYVVPMSVSDGTTSTTTPIYIGNEPLEADEYVDYSEQKIYKYGENLADWDKIAVFHMIRTINQDESITLNTNYIWASCQFATSYDFGEDTLGLQIGHKYTVFFDVIASNYTSTNSLNRCCVRYTSNNQLKYQDSQFLFIIGHHKFSFEYDEALYISFIIANPSVNDPSVTLANFQIAELQPTDPPVPLPALPTVDGVTITAYAGQSVAVPSRFYAKYKKGGHST